MAAAGIAHHMEAVARRLLGEPNAKLSKPDKLRWGSHGSMCVDLGKGVWRDHENCTGGGVLALIERETGVQNGGCADWLRTELGIELNQDSRQPVAAFDYEDEKGELLFQVVRFEPKDFRQRTPDGAGGWNWELGNVRRVLYRLPQILDAGDRTIYIPEGEKDVDNLERLGFAATTCPGGVKKWRAEYSKSLRGADAVILPDNDDSGREHAAAVAKSLAGIAKRVRIVELPGLPPKGDVSNWIVQGGAADELAALVDKAPEGLPCALSVDTINAAELLNMEFRDPRWAIDDVLPEGCTILAGRPKSGKSWLALDWSVAVSAGTNAMGNMSCSPGDVLLIAMEDTQRRLYGRLRAVLQGAPASPRLKIATEWKRTDEGGLDDLRAWHGAHPSARLVVIDTLAMIRGRPERDQGVYAGDYASITALKAIADEFTVPMVLVHHLRKEGASDPLDSVSGTAGLTGSADTVMVLQRKPNEAHGMLYIRGRDVHEQELALEFDNDTGKWTHAGTAQEFRMSEARRQIRRALRETQDPMSPNQIAEVLGKKAGAVRMTLSRMVDADEINRLPNGKYWV